jgi:hypothetical protein
MGRAQMIMCADHHCNIDLCGCDADEQYRRAQAMPPNPQEGRSPQPPAREDDVRQEETGWLPIVLCPTDGVDRMLMLPDGTEIVGAYHNGGLGQRAGWKTARPVDFDRPVYEQPLRGGFLDMPWEARASQPEPEPKQTGTRKETMWLISELPEGVYPTHFRPNDTVWGDARSALTPPKEGETT